MYGEISPLNPVCRRSRGHSEKMAAASQTERQTDRQTPNLETCGSCLRRRVGSVLLLNPQVRNGESEREKPVKAHHRRRNESAKTLSTFPTSVCYVELSLSVRSHSRSLVFQPRPLIFVKSSWGRELEQWNCGDDESRKIPPAEKKVRLRSRGRYISKEGGCWSRISWP